MLDISIVSETSQEVNWNGQTGRQADRQTGRQTDRQDHVLSQADARCYEGKMSQKTKLCHIHYSQMLNTIRACSNIICSAGHKSHQNKGLASKIWVIRLIG